MNIPSTIIFIGPQGSGKGTQAKILAQKIGAKYLDMGGLLREIAKEDTEFGKHIKSLIDNGILVSDEDIEKVLTAKLESLDVQTPIIFDGVPRREKQAEFLFNKFKDVGRNEVATILIDLPREETLKRLSMRRTCEACGTPAIATGDPAQVCAKCGGKLVTRIDDTPEAINKRLDQYHTETMPVLDFLSAHSSIHRIDGNQSIEAVSEQISKALGI